MVELASAQWRGLWPNTRVRGASYCLMLGFALLGCGAGSSSGGDGPRPPASNTGQASTDNATPVADAGPDQTVLGGSTVELVGSGSGDGSLSYQWTQTGGEPSIAIDNADQASASFTAPDVDGSPQNFAFELRVTDSAESTATDTTSVAVHAVPPEITVSGTLQYEFVPPRNNCDGLDYAGTELRPVRGATVQLIDADNGTLIDSDMATESGSYSFTVAGQRRVFVRVRAELKQTGSPNWDVELRDNTSNTSTALANRPLYALDSQAFTTGSSDHVLHLTAPTGWDGSAYSGRRAAAPFAILDTVYAGISLVLSANPDAHFPPLDVFWSVNNSTAQGGGIDRGEIGTSFYNPNIDSLFLLGKADDDTEEFDSHVIAHEWGHFFEDTFSRSDSIGGPHGLGNRLDMRLAFGEGWATALSGMALGSPLYCDTSGSGQSRGFKIDLEHDVTSPRGWFNELSIVSVLYDLWDSKILDDDGGSLGFAPLYEVLVQDQANTPALTSVFSFATALKTRNPEQAGFIDNLLIQHKINGTDAYGSNETNDSEPAGSPPDVLPVYTELVPDGTPVQLCSNSQYDDRRDGNKLSEHRYLRLKITEPGSYRFSAVTRDPSSSPPSGFDCSEPSNSGDPELYKHSDPDFYLLRRGQTVMPATSCTANSETATSGVLAADDYVINLHEFRYEDENTPPDFPERTCFDITVSPAP